MPSLARNAGRAYHVWIVPSSQAPFSVAPSLSIRVVSSSHCSCACHLVKTGRSFRGLQGYSHAFLDRDMGCACHRSLVRTVLAGTVLVCAFFTDEGRALPCAVVPASYVGRTCLEIRCWSHLLNSLSRAFLLVKRACRFYESQSWLPRE